MNSSLRIAAALAVILFATTSADARHRHHYASHHHYARTASISVSSCGPIRDDRYPCQETRFSPLKTAPMGRRQIAPSNGWSMADERIVSHPSGCPGSAFCGCGVSVKVFGHPVRNLYLASNWFQFPRSSPGPGMVAVRNHHVMYIEAMDGNGNATVYDPNSGGHQTRIHTRSLSGYTIVNPNGGIASNEGYSARRHHGRRYAAR